MKLTLACALLVFAVAASIQPDHALAADQTEVAFIPHDKTQAALDNKADIHLLLADDVAVEGNYRNKPGNPELHTKQTNIFYITDGSATIVAGGKYQGGKEISPRTGSRRHDRWRRCLRPGQGRHHRDSSRKPCLVQGGAQHRQLLRGQDYQEIAGLSCLLAD